MPLKMAASAAAESFRLFVNSEPCKNLFVHTSNNLMFVFLNSVLSFASDDGNKVKPRKQSVKM